MRFLLITRGTYLKHVKSNISYCYSFTTFFSFLIGLNKVNDMNQKLLLTSNIAQIFASKLTVDLL